MCATKTIEQEMESASTNNLGEHITSVIDHVTECAANVMSDVSC